jgi:hypothetical protein
MLLCGFASGRPRLGEGFSCIASRVGLLPEVAVASQLETTDEQGRFDDESL